MQSSKMGMEAVMALLEATPDTPACVVSLPGNLSGVLCKNSMYSNHPSSPSFFPDLLLCVCLCMCTHACGTHRCHKKCSGPLELELGVVVVKADDSPPRLGPDYLTCTSPHYSHFTGGQPS